jgi:hypothetical protein
MTAAQFPIEIVASESLINALIGDEGFIAATNGTAKIEQPPDVSSHDFDLATIAAVVALVQGAFGLLKLAPIIKRLFTEHHANSLYIKTPQREVILSPADVETLNALENVLKTLN